MFIWRGIVLLFGDKGEKKGRGVDFFFRVLRPLLIIKASRPFGGGKVYLLFDWRKERGCFFCLMVVWFAFFLQRWKLWMGYIIYSIINRTPSALWLAFKGSYLFFLRSSFYLAGAPLCKLIKAAYYHMFLGLSDRSVPFFRLVEIPLLNMSSWVILLCPMYYRPNKRIIRIPLFFIGLILDK
jgi:hypothetical protein